MNSTIPHKHIVVAFAVAAVGGYAAFSVWMVARNSDPATIGDIIGTWKSFAVAAFAFWLGSSSGGKAKDTPVPDAPTGKLEDPVNVKEVEP